MPGYITESTGGDFKPTPEGQHVMVCCRVIDIGTQKTEFNGETKFQRKVAISWEIPGERVSIDGKDVPVMHTERYTWSFHEKANLRRVLESWRGKKFAEADFAGPPNGFHIKNVIGVPCYGQVIHETAPNGKMYANLSSLMAFPGKRDAWPKVEGPTMYLDLDPGQFDRGVYDALTDYWRGLIQKSPEGAAALGGVSMADERNPPPRDDLDEEIPF